MYHFVDNIKTWFNLRWFLFCCLVWVLTYVSARVLFSILNDASVAAGIVSALSIMTVTGWDAYRRNDAFLDTMAVQDKETRRKLYLLATKLAFDLLGEGKKGAKTFLAIGPCYGDVAAFDTFEECPKDSIAIEVEYGEPGHFQVEQVLLTPEELNENVETGSKGPRLTLILGGLHKDKSPDGK